MWPGNEATVADVHEGVGVPKALLFEVLDLRGIEDVRYLCLHLVTLCYWYHNHIVTWRNAVDNTSYTQGGNYGMEFQRGQARESYVSGTSLATIAVTP